MTPKRDDESSNPTEEKVQVPPNEKDMGKDLGNKGRGIQKQGAGSVPDPDEDETKSTKGS